MKKIFILIALALCLYVPSVSFGQFAFSNGHSSLEIGGYIIGFYQYRLPIPPAGTNPDMSKSTFMLDDARLNLKGFTHGMFKYELEVNFVDVVGLAINGIKDIKHCPITEANVTYLNPILNVKAGYFKVPFSPSSLMDKVPSPFLGRTLIADGDYFTRRDAGVLVFRDFWHQRISVTAGVVSGMGEAIVLGKGDPNGWPEFVARLQLSNAYYREEEIDWRNLPRPLFRVGVDARYNKKSQFYGDGPATYNNDWMNVKFIDGVKVSYGVDASFMWHGFSAQFEMDQAYMRADATNYSTGVANPLYTQLKQYNTNYFKNGGYLLQVNYFNRKLWSVFAARFSEFDPTDLAPNQQQRTMTFAYNLVIPRTALTIKLHYDYRIKQPVTGIKWDNDQFRGGFQYVF